ncbi:TauD/TfdA family dioxygenase [Streptomyces sp. 4503]|uniref:TauD/TfdA family dioxygenase n=1 Tax=Streptomyces niphimycinicus TaxID=2842201 RepID=A0ABS6C8L7_9ACTN|nr:TauD/TfdA family dioxygenase [Streptomyces niphimycinicus]MBU3863219.1 TauD/TfdA family dioxygenase [Streptomyces niphimycinicus]
MVGDREWSPLELTPNAIGVSPGPEGLVEYLAATDLREQLVKAKAIVFRDFRLSPRDLESKLDLFLPNRLAYVHGNSPRTKVGKNVYTSTEYPAEFTISMHNELSYSHHWPTRLLFFCEQAPAIGGATPVVDSTRWLAALDDDVRDAFRGGVRYTQNLHGGAGLGKSWQDTFETGKPDEVEEFLAQADASWVWKPDGGLRVSQLRPSTRKHPVTGDEVWFNQADQWHAAGLGDETAAALRAILPEEDLPQSVTFADGSPIPEEYVVQIRDRGLSNAVDVYWQAGDVLLVDNLLVGHGRRPFSGNRRVLVAMSD